MKDKSNKSHCAISGVNTNLVGTGQGWSTAEGLEDGPGQLYSFKFSN